MTNATGFRDGSSVLNRRQLMWGAAGAGATALFPRRAYASSPYAFRHGAFDITVFSDGHMVVPASMLAVGAPPDRLNEVLNRTKAPAPMMWPAANIPLIRSGHDLILIDVGDGGKFQPTEGKLLAALRANGIDPASITKIVLTHAHPDHLWGMRNAAGELNFPNAAYYVGATEWSFWTASDVATKLPDQFRSIVPQTQRDLDSVGQRVTFMRNGDQIVTGMTVIETPGHTPGQFSLALEGESGLIVTADALTHEVISFEYPEWVNGFDLISDVAIASRRKLLARVAGDRTKLLGFHFSYPGVGYAEAAGSAYRFTAIA
jgi:glyoxylase-like metal-dependent hydrolase (beta-lactamase superfamily II)